MRKRGRFVLLGALALLAMLLAAPPPARAGGMTVGLAVAVTADGSRLVAGGSNRVLYELDPTTLEVKRRVWLGRQIMDMAFSPDGKVLVVESTAAVQWLKTDTLAPFTTIEDAHSIRPIPAIGAVAMLIPDYTRPAIKILSFDDAQERAAVVLDPRQRVAAYGASPDGKQLAVLHSREKNEDEEKIAGGKIPQEIREEGGTALADFVQRHDGYGALYRVFDVASGKATLEKPVGYSCQGYVHLVTWQGSSVYVVGYQNQCARFDAQGEFTVFALANGFNNAVHASPDGKTVWTGGALDGSRTRLPALSSTSFRIDDLPGFNESFKSFTAASDGTAFGGTSAFRVVRVGADGRLQKIAPVY